MAFSYAATCMNDDSSRGDFTEQFSLLIF